MKPPNPTPPPGLTARAVPPPRLLFLGSAAVLLTAGVCLAGSIPEGILGSFDFSEDGGSQETLSRRLEEISGLAVTREGRVFAHNDERAVFYELDPGSGEILKAFSAGIGGIPGDFEGIAILSLIPKAYMNVYLAANVQSPAIDAFLTSVHTWAKSHGFLPEIT